VSGAYSYVDANGDLRQVRYVADAAGYRAEGDVSVDRRTAAAAAQLNALAPKGTVANPVPVGFAPAPYAVAPAPAIAPFNSYYNLGAPAPYALPAPLPLATPIPAWQVAAPAGSRAAYKVVTPGFSIYSQI